MIQLAPTPTMPGTPPRAGQPPGVDVCPIDREAMDVVRSHRRIVVLAEGESDLQYAKTGLSLVRFRSDDVVAWLDSTLPATRLTDCFDAQLLRHDVPVIASLTQQPGADALYVGVAIPGGKLPPAMRRTIDAAVRRGIDVVSGLHDHLSSDPALVAAASRSGSRLVDVRRSGFRDVATAHALTGPATRLATIGQDCSVGKMMTSLELARGLTAAGYDATFLPTGQSGIMIDADGVPVDALIADFANGAVEDLVRRNQHRDFTVLEGQGSLLHPAYSNVTLSLLHGGQPHGVILCYEPGRPHTKSYPHVPLPPLGRFIELIRCLSLGPTAPELIGVAMNGRRLTVQEADIEKQRQSDELGLPVCDVVRDGPGELIAAARRLRTRLHSESNGTAP